MEPEVNLKIPSLRQGYIIVAAAFIIQLVAFSLSDSYGVFVNPWVDTFGWSRAAISGAYSIAFLVMGLAGILMGIITDRRGPRLALTLCALALGLGYFLVSRMQAPWQLDLAYGIVFGLGMSGVWAPLLSLIPRWFAAHRGLLTGIVISGGGIGAFLGPPVITRLIDGFGWSRAVLGLGIFAFLVVVLSAQFLKRGPSSKAKAPDGPAPRAESSSLKDFSLVEVLKTRQFWTAFALLFCLAFYTFSVLVHLMPHAIQLGIIDSSAAYVLATISGMSIAGNFVMGRVGDRIGPRKVLIISFVLMSAALFWLQAARSLWALYLFSLVFGFNHGGNATAQAPLMANLFGLKAHGAIFAAASFGFTLGGAIGPLVTGYIFDRAGEYQPAFLVCGLVGLLGLVLTLLLKPAPRLSPSV